MQDSRILIDDQHRLMLLTNPTEQYAHTIMGDAIEARSITLIQTIPAVKVVTTFDVAEDVVIEGLQPLWMDLTGDGQREIIVTIANDTQGAQIVVYNEQGTLLAEGPAIGQGSRWRHQLTVVPFDNNQLTLVDVLTPHIGGVVEFYRLEDNSLIVEAEVPGYTSHVIGSRNLELAASSDFDSDGNLEVLLPSQSLTNLAAISYTSGSANVEWELPIGGQISSNLFVTQFDEGQVAVAVGSNNLELRLWLP